MKEVCFLLTITYLVCSANADFPFGMDLGVAFSIIAKAHCLSVQVFKYLALQAVKTKHYSNLCVAEKILSCGKLVIE